MTRAELELAVRAELVDMAATTWRAKVAADYILAVVDHYVQAERERMEKRLREIMDFYLDTRADADRRRNSTLARWIAEDCHRAVCRDQTHNHKETPWSSALRQRA